MVDQNGTPFPIFGDAGWEVSHNVNTTDQTTYLQSRANSGFNAVLQEAIDHKFTNEKPPMDIAGNLPFGKRLDGATYTGSPNGCTTPNGNESQYAADPYGNINAQSPDFSYPTEAYWSRLDSYIALCAQYGIAVLLFPSYIGYAGGDEGWMGEMVANDAVTGAGGISGQAFADNTKSRLWNYGAWIANRYKNTTNIVWVQGGDYGTDANHGGLFTTAQKNAVNSLFAGIKSIAGQKSVLQTAHWARGSIAPQVSLPAGSFDLASAYTDTASAQWSRTAYGNTPIKPSFEIEDYYEGTYSGNPGEPFRRFHWWEMLSAIGGYFSGTDQLWQTSSNFLSYLQTQGTKDNQRLFAFMRSVAWQNLVPSGLGGMKNLITAGGGTGSPQSTDYVAAAATPDGTLLVAYVPPAHTGSITVDLTAMSGSTTAQWFNPTTAAYTSIGTFPNTGTQAFTPLGNNGSGFTDWVLVLTSTGASSPPPSFAVKINFQTSTSATPSGYLADSGATFADRGNGYSYGWNGDNSAQSRERDASNSPDKRYDTLNQMQRPANPNAIWELAVPNGTYNVRLVSGDPSYTDSVYAISAESTVVLSGTPNANQLWFDTTNTIMVSDGRLTLGNASGSTNNKMNFIEVTSTTGSPPPQQPPPQQPPPQQSFALKINFQASTSTTPSGYLADIGSTFADRGNGYSYGWNGDNTAQARERDASNSPDSRYDTLNQFQRPANPNGSWEVAVPNGSYTVHIVAGDPSYTDSTYALAAEGVLAVSGTPTANQLWFDVTVTVPVSDGRLTLSNASGSVNNKINFIEISSN